MTGNSLRLVTLQRPEPQRRVRRRRLDGVLRNHDRTAAVLARAVFPREVIGHFDRVPAVLTGELDAHVSSEMRPGRERRLHRTSRVGGTPRIRPFVFHFTIR
jgi:hypothetical protein